jgi:hypothetical protein
VPSITKLYLTSTTAPYTPATIRGAWDESAGHDTRALQSYKLGGGASATVARSESLSTNPYSVLLYRGVSDPLEAQTIAGTIDVVIGVLESNAAADFYWHLHVYVTQGDSDTPRGTLLNNYVENTSNEWPTTIAGHGLASAQALSSLGVSAGDRLVVEIGYVSRNAVTNFYTGTLRYGASVGLGADYADLTLASTAVSTRAGYISFPSGITIADATDRATQVGAELLAEPSTMYARATQVGSEVAWHVLINARVSQVGVEILWQGVGAGVAMGSGLPRVPGAPLLLFGNDLLSHEYSGGLTAPSGYVSVGTVDPLFPGTNLNNGNMAAYTRVAPAGGAVAFAIDLKRSGIPDAVFAFNTNFDQATEVRLQGSASSGFGVLTTDVEVTGSGPHRWIDLRDLTPTAARYWRWYVEGVEDYYACGEFVVTIVTDVTPHLQWGFADDVHFAGTTQGTTPLRARVRRAYGAHVRRRGDLRVQGTRAYTQHILNAIHSVQDFRWPLAFVPNNDETDCWWVELQGINIDPLGANLRRITFALVEQGGGVIDA